MIQKDALLRVVKATRLSLKTAEILSMLYSFDNGESYCDTVSGLLVDALSCIGREELEVGENFLENSKILKLLQSNMSDGEVMNEIAKMAEFPAPQTMERNEVEKLYRENGGYMAGG